MFKLNLVPKDKIFFDLFNQLSTTLVDMTNEFDKFINDYDNKDKYIANITEFEKKGRKISEALLKELIYNYITPIDREDVHALTKLLNSIVEHVNAATVYFDLYKIEKINSYVIELAKRLKDAVGEIKYLMDHIEDMSAVEKVYPHIEKLREIEEEGDVIYRDAVRELFSRSDNPLNIIRWKDVYHRLENAVDKCSDTGSIMLGMILKYA
ncbi:MAG: DUF47 family protein [Candidatus Sericytochromatia bacterium]